MQLISALNPQEGKPLEQLPPAAKLISWLIVSHHKMPLPYDKEDWRDEPAPDISSIFKWIDQSWGYENRRTEQKYQKRLKACFEFPLGLLSCSSPWFKQLKKWARRLQNCLPTVEQLISNGNYRLILHHARLCLMLGDHFHSSQEADKNWQDTTGLFANTDRKVLIASNIKLDEHLVGVA